MLYSNRHARPAFWPALSFLSARSYRRVFRIVFAIYAGATVSLAQETVSQYKVESGTDAIDDILVATGDGHVPSIAGTDPATHRDAFFVTGGGSLALLSGANVTVKNDNNLTAFLRIGYGDATSGSMTIADGAALTVGQPTRYANLQVGEGNEAIGSVTQTGGDVTVGGSFNIGVNGGTGTWTISSGSITLYNGLYNIGFNNLDSGPSSAGQFVVDDGLVTVQGGNFIIGDRATNGETLGNGDGVVTQNGGTFRFEGTTDADNLFLAAYGNGQYNLNGGTLEIGGNHLRARYLAGTGDYSFNLGGGAIKVIDSTLTTAVDAALVDGTISTIDTNGLGGVWGGNLTGSGNLQKEGAGELALTGSANSFGVLNIQEGSVKISSGSTTVTQVLVGANGNDANGTLEIRGGTFSTASHSSNTDLRTVYLGSGDGNTGNLLLSGGTFNVGLAATPEVRADFEVGSFSGTGTATQTGGSLVLNSLGGYFHIGNQGTGVYNLEDGTISTQNAFVLGRSTELGLGDGTLNISGGTLTIAARDKAALILGGVDAGNTVVGGKGTVNQTGGTVQVGDYLELGTKGGTGTYTLDGGTLEIGGAGGIRRDATGTADFTLGGGTIKVVRADLASSVAMSLVDRDPTSAYTQSFIDTNGFNASLSGAITGDGTLVKMGAGNLTLSGANNITGETYVVGGAILQTGGASEIRYLAVGSGNGATGAYTLSSGSLSISQALQVGDWGGNGTFEQTGGALSVTGSFNVGNQGGTGIYNLSGGSLTLSDGLYNLGRNTGSNPASTGTLNLSGGLLEVSSGNFILGNRDATATTGNGSGTLNQTGGVLRVAGVDGGNNLYLSAYGDGEYNLLGGTLEIGGNHLQAKYNGGAGGTYAFNLGGGTIKVIGADLSAGLNATLVAATADNNVASKIDTNGYNATWSGTITGADGGLIKKGTGNLTFNGSGERTIGYLNSDAGRVVHSAGTTTVTELVVGSNHETMDGAFTLSGGTIVLAGSTAASPSPSFRIGDWGGTGEFEQTGGTIHADGSVVVGNRAGTGSYTLSGGTLNIGENAGSDNSALILGRSREADAVGSTGIFAATGGTLHLFSNAPLLVGGDTFPVADSGRAAGTFTQSGTAVVRIDSYLSLAANGTGTYNLDGGTLQVGGTNGIRQGSGTATFNMGSGTVQVLGSDLATNVALTLQAGQSGIIDTKGLNATFSGDMISASDRQIDYGGNKLAKQGEGTLTLSGNNRALNTFAVEEGTARQSAGVTTAVEFMAGTGAGNTGSFTMDGGSLTINASTDTNGDPVAGSFRVGDFGGTGTFTQNGGEVTVTENGALNIGNQGGTGTYNLADGTLSLRGGLNVLARSAAGKDASSGHLNISGGVLELRDNSSLIIGNNFGGADVQLGSGSVVQTGGRVVVESGSNLYVAGFGNGSYALNGGTLEIGGSSLHARYNNTSSSYAFNLGGGTIKVTGSDLNATLDATLASDTRSTIDTNGMDATWSGALGGAGGLTKAGTGTLTLSNTANTFAGGLWVDAGTLSLTGVLLNSEITVANGAMLTGNGAAAGLVLQSGSSFAPGLELGTFTVNGDVLLAPGSTMFIGIGATGNDLLAATGMIDFGGTLQVSLLDGFDPVLGSSFDLFDFGGETGAFSSLSLPALGGGLWWDYSQLYIDGTISVSAVPEPATTAAIAGAIMLGFALWRRKRCRARSEAVTQAGQ